MLCQLSVTASNILISEVIPANATEIKKNTAKALPNGILWNTVGSAMNISDGPRVTSTP